MKRFFLIALMLLLAPSAFAAQTEPLYIITRTQSEAEPLIAAAGAERLDVRVILEKDYASVPGSKVATTLPAAARDAINAGIAPFCAGARFDSDGRVSVSEPQAAAVRLTYGDYTQTDEFVDGVRLLTDVNGTGVGSVTLSGGREYPFAAKCENAWYAPWYDGGGLCAIALADILRDYCAEERWTDTFLMIDEVYPFSDLDALRESAQMLNGAGIPFIVRVMPVYDNLDYPAFLRYADTLRYVQSIGGTIVAHWFIEKPAQPLREPPEERMERFVSALEEQGLHPLPMPYSPLTLDMDALERITTEGKKFPAPHADVLILFETGDAAAGLLKRINDKWLDISDYRLRYTTERYSYEKREIPEDYVYIEEEKLMLANEFTLGNNVLYILIIVILIVFGVLFAIGRGLYRRKFYR